MSMKTPERHQWRVHQYFPEFTLFYKIINKFEIKSEQSESASVLIEAAV